MLAYNVIVLGLAAVASAQTFSGFSDSGIVCQGGNTATKAEVDSAIVGPKGTITQAKASDLGYGRCQNLNVPMYSVSCSSVCVGFINNKGRRNPTIRFLSDY